MDQQYFPGHFLIALPRLKGDFFQDTITLLIEHSEAGAFGLVINKPSTISLADLLETNTIGPVMMGGPVEPDHLYFLHSIEKTYDESTHINADIALSTSSKLLQDLTSGTAPEHILALLGYAGWGAAQLESEIREDVWLIAPFNKNVVFSTPFDQRPAEAARQMGLDLNLIMSDRVNH